MLIPVYFISYGPDELESLDQSGAPWQEIHVGYHDTEKNGWTFTPPTEEELFYMVENWSDMDVEKVDFLAWNWDSNTIQPDGSNLRITVEFYAKAVRGSAK